MNKLSLRTQLFFYTFLALLGMFLINIENTSKSLREALPSIGVEFLGVAITSIIFAIVYFEKPPGDVENEESDLCVIKSRASRDDLHERIRNAEHEVVISGIALDFIRAAFQTHEFRVRQNCKYRFFVIHSDLVEETADFLGENPKDLAHKIETTITAIERKFEEYPNNYEIVRLKRRPSIGCVMIDPKRKAEYMSISPYLHKVKGEDSPVFIICREKHEVWLDLIMKSLNDWQLDKNESSTESERSERNIQQTISQANGFKAPQR